MLKKNILIFSFLLPFALLSQEMDQEPAQEVPIGSSGIDLFPEEEVSTPTEPSSEPSVEPAAPVAPPADSAAPETPPVETVAPGTTPADPSPPSN